MCYPKNMKISTTALKIRVIDDRIYGDPKLRSLKQLHIDAEKIGSITFGKCKCPVYKNRYRIYIKHRDWFSESISIDEALEYGIIEKKKNKFIYNDNFGSVVLRNEAWLEMKPEKGFKPELVEKMIQEIEYITGLKNHELHNADWTIFFEELVDLCQLNQPTLELERLV